jgi:hypothetical protein
MDTIGQPEATEYAPYYERYVALVRGGDILKTLEEQAEAVRRSLHALPEARAAFRYAPGKWSVREVIGHWTDGERVLAYRTLAFARASGHDSIPLAGLVEEFSAVRSATLLLLRHLPPQTWNRVGVANGKPVSVRALAFIMAGHVAHHVAMLHDRYVVAPGR